MKPLYSASDFEKIYGQEWLCHKHAEHNCFLAGCEDDETIERKDLAARIANAKHTPCAEERERMVKAMEVMREVMVNVRSELTHAKNNIDEHWCVDEICTALAEVEKIMGEK